jgi:AAA ATPase domain
MDGFACTECLEGTRADILEFIWRWAFDLSTGSRLLWLHGLVGSGKSTISTTFATRCDEQGYLGTFLFFNRDEGNQPSNVIRTLAYELSAHDARIRAGVVAAIKATLRIAKFPLRTQFYRLITEPLSNLPTTETPIIIILDAVDECGTAETRRAFLALLSAEFDQLPSFIHVLITSRAELDIRMALGSKSHITARELDLMSSNNIGDILSFLHFRMMEIHSIHTSLLLAHDWPATPQSVP